MKKVVQCSFQGLVPCGGCTAAIQLLRAGFGVKPSSQLVYPISNWLVLWILVVGGLDFRLVNYPWNYPLVGGDWNHGKT